MYFTQFYRFYQFLICIYWFCSCVPLYHFDHIYNYLMYTNISFVDWYDNLSPLGFYRDNSHSSLCFLLSIWHIFTNVNFSFLLLASRILVLTAMAGIQIACFLKLRWRTLERVHRYILAQVSMELGIQHLK